VAPAGRTRRAEESAGVDQGLGVAEPAGDLVAILGGAGFGVDEGFGPRALGLEARAGPFEERKRGGIPGGMGFLQVILVGPGEGVLGKEGARSEAGDTTDEGVEQAGHRSLGEVEREHDSEPGQASEEGTAAVRAGVEDPQRENAAEPKTPSHIVVRSERAASSCVGVVT